MRSTDYISKGTAVARLYKAREYLLMDKDCRKGLCFYLRSVDILDYLEEIGIWNLDTFSIEVLWAYEDFINRSCIVAMGNVKVVERKLNTMYSWKDSFDARSSSKEIWGCRYRPGMVNLFWASLCEHVWCVDVGYPLIRGAKISWYSKGRTVPLNFNIQK